MKILFLDVDGVLNCDTTEETTKTGWAFVEDVLVERLQRIVKATNATIVLSSDWRLDWWSSEMEELRAKFAEYDLTIADKTSLINGGMDREREIKLYLLTNHNIENFAILDDYYLFPKYNDHFVHTNERFGLTEEDVEKTINILQN